MTKSFTDIMDYWQFKSWRLLADAIERGGAVARTAADVATLDRMEVRLVKIVEEERQRAGDGRVVPQIPSEGRYASAVIDSRWQVMQSVIGTTFYVVDHSKDDLIVREGGPASNVRRFFTREEAEGYVFQFTGQPEGVTGGPAEGRGAGPRQTTTQENDMARPPKKAEAPAKKSAPAKKAAATGAPTKAHTFRSLIMANATAKKPLTDDQIFEAAQKAHPDLDESKRNYVKWYRNDLKKAGQNPPDPYVAPAPKASGGGRKTAQPEA